jgi:molecular chaperone DnaK
MRVLGIDFGTSNTVAMLRTSDGRVRPLLFDGSPLLPSAVYLNTDGRMLVGRDAERNARLDPSRFEPNPKRRIDDGQILLGGVELPVQRVIGHVLAYVGAEARRQLGAAPDEVRLTHPARWAERRRSLLVQAARVAGLGTPRLIAEPVGAASYFTAVLGSAVPAGRSLAIYDLGGGTFDASVVRRTPTGFEVLAEEGLADVGGLDFDHAIVDHLGRTYQDTHPVLWRRLVAPSDASDRRNRRMLYEDARGAKEMLSRTSSADIHLPALEVDAHLTRAELDTLIRPHLDSTVACLRRAVAAARLTPAQLVGIFLVGGSSRIPLAGRLIHSDLGVAPTTLEQPETVVVEGALGIGAPIARSPAGGVSGVPHPFAPAPANRPVSPRPVSPSPVAPSPAGRPVSPSPSAPVASRPARQVPPAGPVSPPPAARPLTGVAGARPGPPAPIWPAPPHRPGAPSGAAAPSPVPVHPRSPAVPPPRAVPPPAGRPAAVPAPPVGRQRPWYAEPAVAATVVVLILVAVAFVVLLNTALR